MAGKSDLDVTADWYWEGNVVEAIARFLANTLDDRQQGRHALALFADAKTPRSLKVSNYEANYQTVLCVSVSTLWPYAPTSVVAFPEICASLIVPGI